MKHASRPVGLNRREGRPLSFSPGSVGHFLPAARGAARLHALLEVFDRSFAAEVSFANTP